MYRVIFTGASGTKHILQGFDEDSAPTGADFFSDLDHFRSTIEFYAPDSNIEGNTPDLTTAIFQQEPFDDSVL